jgi:hypothetical protein
MLTQGIEFNQKEIEKFQNKKMILLVRDPRDTVVSFYFQIKKRQKAYQDSLSSFIKDEHLGIKSIIKYLNCWQENKHKPADFMLVKYEDLHQDIFYQIKRILKFIGLNEIEEELIHKAIEFASFQNMKKLERSDFFKTSILRPSDKDDPESYKVRRGKIGGYKDYLNKKDLEYVQKQMQELSDYYGYSVGC